MYVDKRAEFCDSTAIAATAGSNLVGSQVDLSKTGLNIGVGDNPYLVIQVDADVESAGAATIQFKLMSDATAVVDPDTGSEHFATAAIPKATLVAGYRAAAIKLPMGTYERFLGIVAVTGTAETTAGSISAFLTNNPTAIKAYPDAL